MTQAHQDVHGMGCVMYISEYGGPKGTGVVWMDNVVPDPLGSIDP